MKHLLYIVMLLTAGIASAQQEAMHTQYMDNQIIINPAYAGSKEYLSITGLHRIQWTGFDGAPVTTSVSIHTPLKYRSIGLGLDFLNDKIGPLNRTNASLDFSYRVHFKKDQKLCFGLKAGLDHYSGDLAMLDQSGNDPLAASYSGLMTPTFGAGIYYFSPKWFIGAGMPRITSNLSGEVGGLDNARHVFAIGGAVIPVSDHWKLRPSTQIRVSVAAPINADFSLATIYADQFWLGLNYRLNEGIGAYVQYQITEQFKVGYAYDFPLNSMRGTTMGSHEVLLSYGLVKKEKGLTSPRYF